jgi:hypothetical protein
MSYHHVGHDRVLMQLRSRWLPALSKTVLITVLAFSQARSMWKDTNEAKEKKETSGAQTEQAIPSLSRPSPLLCCP